MNYTFENYVFSITIVVLTIWLTFVTSKGGLTDNRLKGFKVLTKRGKRGIAIGVLIVIIMCLQEWNNKIVSDKIDDILRTEQQSRFNEVSKGINSGVEKSTQQLFENLSVAFKKQGLQYDTIKNQVLKLRDSIKTTIINGEPPLIAVTNLQIIDSTYFKKTYKIEYNITSYNAASYDVDLEFDILAFTPNSNVLTVKKNINIFYKGQSINKDQLLSNTIDIPKDSSFYSLYAFRLKGSIRKSDNTKILIDKFYLLKPRVKKNYFQLPVQVHENYLRAYLAKN